MSQKHRYPPRNYNYYGNGYNTHRNNKYGKKWHQTDSNIDPQFNAISNHSPFNLDHHDGHNDRNGVTFTNANSPQHHPYIGGQYGSYVHHPNTTSNLQLQPNAYNSKWRSKVGGKRKGSSSTNSNILKKHDQTPFKSSTEQTKHDTISSSTHLSITNENDAKSEDNPKLIWKLDARLLDIMKNAKDWDKFTSPTFYVKGYKYPWNLVINPKRKYRNGDKFEMKLRLSSLPPGSEKAVVLYKIIVEQTETIFDGVYTPNKSYSSILEHKLDDRLKLKDIENLSELTIYAKISVISVMDKDDNDVTDKHVQSNLQVALQPEANDGDQMELVMLLCDLSCLIFK